MMCSILSSHTRYIIYSFIPAVHNHSRWARPHNHTIPRLIPYTIIYITICNFRTPAIYPWLITSRCPTLNSVDSVIQEFQHMHVLAWFNILHDLCCIRQVAVARCRPTLEIVSLVHIFYLLMFPFFTPYFTFL